MRYTGEICYYWCMHLLNASRDRLEQTVAALQDIKVKKIMACHCRGGKAVRFPADCQDCTVVMGYYVGLSFSF